MLLAASQSPTGLTNPEMTDSAGIWRQVTYHGFPRLPHLVDVRAFVPESFDIPVVEHDTRRSGSGERLGHRRSHGLGHALPAPRPASSRDGAFEAMSLLVSLATSLCSFDERPPRLDEPRETDIVDRDI